MRGYKIKQEGNLWYFELIPCNNNGQPIGQSMVFDSREKCVAGIKEMRMTIIENRICSIDSSYIVLNRNERKWSFSYLCNGIELYSSRWYDQKQNCKKSVEAIFENIDEYTSREVIDQ